MKKCTKCNKYKDECEFYKKIETSNELRSSCKDCQKVYYQKNREKILERTKVFCMKHPWKQTLIDIKKRCNDKNNSHYKNYGDRRIKCFITEEEIKKLWFRDKAYLMKKPSIDRKDNDGDYTLKNCRFIEFSENSGRNKCRSVLQYSLIGEFIKKWPSVTTAAKQLKLSKGNISYCALGKLKSIGKFVWKYKED